MLVCWSWRSLWWDCCVGSSVGVSGGCGMQQVTMCAGMLRHCNTTMPRLHLMAWVAGVRAPRDFACGFATLHTHRIAMHSVMSGHAQIVCQQWRGTGCVALQNCSCLVARHAFGLIARMGPGWVLPAHHFVGDDAASSHRNVIEVLTNVWHNIG